MSFITQSVDFVEPYVYNEGVILNNLHCVNDNVFGFQLGGKGDSNMSAIVHIKNSIPIMAALDRYTAVRCAGIRWRSQFNICCPFHNDRNPSFTVYTNTNTFRCWSGCNDGRPGDVIDIVKLSENVDTKQAIKILITDFELEKPNIKQVEEWKKNRADRERSFILIREVNKKIHEAMDALKEVELSANSILATIRRSEDLDRMGSLYHVIVQINYWLDYLIESSDTVGRIQTLQEVSRFLQNMREGEE